MAQRILRPLELGDILDEMFDLYKKNFLLFTGISGVLILPVTVLSYAFGLEVAQILGAILMLPVSFVAMAATTWAVSQTYLGNKPTILGSYKALRGRFIAFVVTMIIVTIIISCGTMACIVPGIIFSLWYAFISEVFVVEGKTWANARNRSKQLAEGQWGRIIVIGVLSVLITWVANVVIAVPFGVFNMANGTAQLTGAQSLMYGVVEGLVKTLTTPIGIIAFVLLYYDIRVRKEGFDLELLAQSMGESAATLDSAAENPEQVQS